MAQLGVNRDETCMNVVTSVSAIFRTGRDVCCALLLVLLHTIKILA